MKCIFICISMKKTNPASYKNMREELYFTIDTENPESILTLLRSMLNYLLCILFWDMRTGARGF